MRSQCNTSGYLVVRRINPAKDVPIDNPIARPDIRPPNLALSHEGVLARYRGLDGWPWPGDSHLAMPPLANGLAVTTPFTALEEYYEETSKLYPCDLMYLDFAHGVKTPVGLPPNFRFLGYDYGYYQWEDNLFSSLFHEVIYGVYDEMIAFAKLLNDNLLLPSVDIAQELHCVRTQLLEIGAHLERNGEVLSPIAIYGSDRHQP